jgi:polar amino acid transport system permease protein
MADLFDFKIVFTNIPKILKYLPVTLEITVLATVFGLILALLIAIVKIKKIPVLKRIVQIYVSFMRGTPLIVQLYLTYYGIPMALKYINYYKGTNYTTNGISPIVFVVVTFALSEAAYNSESIRAAILSVDKGQIEAANSLGMTYPQVLRRIIIPEAVVVALPTLGNALISLLKGTSLAFVCAVIEMTAQGKILAGSSYRQFESYISLALIYWGLTIIIEKGLAVVERKFSIPDMPVRRKGVEND